MSATTASAVPAGVRPPLYKSLFVQVVAALILGILIGVVAPDFAIGLKFFSDAFLKLISMIVAPIVFCVVVHGIAGAGDLRKVGRVGLKALIYFEVVTTLARAWAVTRADGMVLGFTDHDAGLSFEGIAFRPDAGLTAQALVQGLGLAVDNTEAQGAAVAEGLLTVAAGMNVLRVAPPLIITEAEADEEAEAEAEPESVVPPDEP